MRLPSQWPDLKHSPNRSLEEGPLALCYLAAPPIHSLWRLCSKATLPRASRCSCHCWNNRWLCKQVGASRIVIARAHSREAYFIALVKVYIPVPNLPAGVSTASLPVPDDPRMTEHREHLGTVQRAVWPASPRLQPLRVPCQRSRSLPLGFPFAVYRP